MPGAVIPLGLQKERDGMTDKTLGIALLAAATIFAACAGRAQEQRIAVVDMEQVLSIHPDTKEAETTLQKQVEDYDKEKQDMLSKFERLKKEFEDARSEADNRALSEDGRAQKRKQAEDKLAALRDFDEEVRQTTLLRQKQLNDRKKRMRGRIVEDIKAKIGEYAAKKGYTMVLDSGPIQDSFGVVVYKVESVDITADVVKLLGGDLKKTAAKAPPEIKAPEVKKTAAQPQALPQPPPPPRQPKPAQP